MLDPIVYAHSVYLTKRGREAMEGATGDPGTVRAHIDRTIPEPATLPKATDPDPIQPDGHTWEQDYAFMSRENELYADGAERDSFSEGSV